MEGTYRNIPVCSKAIRKMVYVATVEKMMILVAKIADKIKTLAIQHGLNDNENEISDCIVPECSE